MTQGVLDFTSPSPINRERLTGQNGRLYAHLLTGARINCLDKAMYTLRIGYLNSRISDLENKHHIPIQREYISIPDIDGKPVTVREYWLPESYLKDHKDEE